MQCGCVVGWRSQVNDYVEREIMNHRSLQHPHIIAFKEVGLLPPPRQHPFAHCPALQLSPPSSRVCWCRNLRAAGGSRTLRTESCVLHARFQISKDWRMGCDRQDSTLPKQLIPQMPRNTLTWALCLGP